MKNRPSLSLFAAAITMTLGCAADPSEELVTDDPEELAAVCAAPIIDIDRSLFVSPTVAIEQNELRARFPVSRIMNHILASSGATAPANGTELFRRWWDTQNSAATAQFPDNPHCSDNGGTINGFPVQCPRNEAQLATALPDGHFPVALVYRPDLAARDGSTCGEARVVIANGGPGGRNLPIFEASIPNPSPGCGVVGCRKIAQFWAKLSSVSSFSQRLDALERFYFLGLNLAQDGVVTRPVLDAQNLGLPASNGVRRGQIRTNQFMSGPHHPLLWQLREFKLNRTCISPAEEVPDTTNAVPAPCKLFFEPVTDKTNPWGALFDDTDPHPRGAAFRNEFLNQLVALSPQDVNAIGMAVSNTFNAGQSNSQGNQNLYTFHLNQGDPAGFEQTINDKLTSLGIPLTADHIAARATTQSCAGCHQLSSGASLGPQQNPLIWPLSLGFVHTHETGLRSPALNVHFLPKRKQILEKFLIDTCNGVCPVEVEPDPTPLAGRNIVH